FFMLLGMGCGAAFSQRLFPTADLSRCVFIIVLTLLVLRLGFFAASLLEQVVSATGRMAVVGTVVALVGFVLGWAFPLGVQRAAPTGEWAIQKLWAINGAASIAASVLGAVIGFAWGSGAVLTAGMFAYAAALVAAIVSRHEGNEFEVSSTSQGMARSASD